MGSCPARQTKRNYAPLLSDFASCVHLSRNNPNLTNEFVQTIGFGAPGRFNDFCLRFPRTKIVPIIGPEVTVGCLGVFPPIITSFKALPDHFGPKSTKNKTIITIPIDIPL